MIATDWRNRPYSERPEPPVDVGAAACQARADRHTRHWRIARWFLITAAWVIGAWLYSMLGLSRVESLLLVLAYLAVRTLHAVERRAVEPMLRS